MYDKNTSNCTIIKVNAMFDLGRNKTGKSAELFQ